MYPGKVPAIFSETRHKVVRDDCMFDFFIISMFDFFIIIKSESSDTVRGPIYASMMQPGLTEHFGPQWSLKPCNRHIRGGNGGLGGDADVREGQTTGLKCVTRRALSSDALTFEQSHPEMLPLNSPRSIGQSSGFYRVHSDFPEIVF
jgi:hypothetical protein